MKSKIFVFTSTRAEYGLLKKLCKLIDKEISLDLTLIVTGTHLSYEHGYTFKGIKDDGFNNYKLISLPLDSGKTISDITSILLKEISIIFQSSKPNFFIVLGDRYEALGAVFAAYVNKIPIMHLHGGEVTEGSLDNGFRNAISQLSSFHFTSHKIHTKNLIEMGIDNKKIFEIGPMFLDILKNHDELNKEEFEKSTNYKFSRLNILVAFHPESYKHDYGVEVLRNSLLACLDLKANILASYPNIDEGHELIKKLLKEFSLEFSDRFFIYPSLGNSLFISSMKLFDVMIGNSSSGILEAPLIGIPVINIGDRQKGRVTFGKVYNSKGDFQETKNIIRKIDSNKGVDVLKPDLQMNRNSPSYEIIRVIKKLNQK